MDSSNQSYVNGVAVILHVHPFMPRSRLLYTFWLDSVLSSSLYQKSNAPRLLENGASKIHWKELGLDMNSLPVPLSQSPDSAGHTRVT
jgi:hypothetical protein